MIEEIISATGDHYTFDPDTESIARNGVFLGKSEAEPVYGGNNREDGAPEFSGIYLKNKGQIVSRSGRISQVCDENLID